MNRPTLILLLFIALLGSLTAISQQTGASFSLQTRYLVYLPQGYTEDTAKKWPMIMFLHGSGESGADLDRVKLQGIPKLIDKGKEYPFVIISPQAETPRSGFQPFVLHELLNSVKNQYRIDPERVYLTGLSMGGYGTWELAAEYPGEFAAIAPVCGGGEAGKAWRLRHMPVWCFHGDKDEAVPIKESQVMVDSLKKYNAPVRFTIYRGMGHNSWDSAYDGNDLFDWFLTKKRYRHPVPPGTLKIPADYAGRYTGPGNDTLTFVLGNNKLILANQTDSLELKASGQRTFYLIDTDPTEVIFERNKNGQVIGFLVYDWKNKTWFRKIR